MIFFQVKWDGWPKTTWEPEENLQGCQEAIDNFLVEEKTRLRMEEDMEEDMVADIYIQPGLRFF